MFKKILTVISVVVCMYMAYVLLTRGSYLYGLLFLYAAGHSVYKSFFASPTPPLPSNITTFDDFKNAAAQRGATGLFIGKIPELQASATYGSFAGEILEQQSQALAKVRGVATGNALLDIGLNAGMHAGINKLVSSSTDILVARFSDGSHLSTVLSNGTTNEMVNFLTSSRAAGIPVEGNFKKSPMIGRPVLIFALVALSLPLVIYVIGLLFFNSGK